MLKTAKEMFEELGYKLVPYDVDDCLYYEDNIKEYIKFGIKTKLFYSSRSVNLKELEAINQQIKELCNEDKMNDIEKLENLLKEFEIDYAKTYNEYDKNYDIEFAVGWSYEISKSNQWENNMNNYNKNNKIKGYRGFTTKFRFDNNKKFLDVWIDE